MGLFNKISNLIFEEAPDNNDSNTPTPTTSKKGSWKDIFFEDASDETSITDNDKKRKKSFLDLFYEDASEEISTPDNSKKRKKSFLDLFFEEESGDEIKSTFVTEDPQISAANDILSQIQRRESELINLAEFFKTVNPNDYPDSGPEYEAYLSLVKQLNAIKELSKNSSNSTISSINNYQLESNFRKFELDYQAHINSIQSLCYLSEISALNIEMQKLFSSHFTTRTERKIKQTEGYILLISQKSDKFDKKYSSRLYKQLIEAEYRLTLLKLMSELKNDENPRTNPFSSFSSIKKETFQTYLSKDIRDSNTKYNEIADNKEKYVKYTLIDEELFDKIDVDAEIISERINKYTLDNFLLNELLDNGEGFETLKKFLKFKLILNFIDSKTAEADKRFLDDNYKNVTSNRRGNSGKNSSSTHRNFPNFDDNF